MTTLDSIKKYTIVVADTGDLNAIKTFNPADATTNPSLILKVAEEGQLNNELNAERKRLKNDKNYSIIEAAESISVRVGVHISRLIPGFISTEVDARLSYDKEKMVNAGRRIISKYEELGINKKRILIKLAATWEGINACKTLEKEGIQCNLTLLFNESQAIAAANAGATLISPFVGRIYDWHLKNGNITGDFKSDPGVRSVKKIFELFKENKVKTIIMGASFRNIQQIISLTGCDRLTISPSLLDELAQSNHLVTPIEYPEIKSDRLPILSQSEFLLSIAKDSMATEKLADGICRFISDQEKLEKLLT